MRNIKLMLVAVIAMAVYSTTSFANSWGIGASGNMAVVAASGKETAGDTAGSETDNSVRDATAGNAVMFGSVFMEYTFNDSWTFGIDYIPGSADVNDKNLSRTDAGGAPGAGTDTSADGTVTTNAEISDHITYYVEMGKMNGIYGKIGYAQVDIDVQQTNTTNNGTYPDKTLDAWVLGLGYKGAMGDSGFYKIEGFMYDYDSYAGTSNSTNANTVSADLDVTGAKFAVGINF